MIFPRFSALFSFGRPNTTYQLSALIQRSKLYRKSPQNSAPPPHIQNTAAPTCKIQPKCSNSFLSYIIKQYTSHHLISFHFSTFYLASSTSGHVLEGMYPCPVTTNIYIAPNYTPLFVSPYQRVNPLNAELTLR